MRSHSVVAVVDLAHHDGKRFAQPGRKRAVLKHAGLVQPHTRTQLPRILTLNLQDLPDPAGTRFRVTIDLLKQTLRLLRICVLDPCHMQIVGRAARACEIHSESAESRPRFDFWGSFLWLRPELRHDSIPFVVPSIGSSLFPSRKIAGSRAARFCACLACQHFFFGHGSRNSGADAASHPQALWRPGLS